MNVLRLVSAVVLCVAIVAATSSVARADDFVIGRVVALYQFESQGYFAEVQLTTDRVVVPLSQELYDQLEVGDTLVQRGADWSLLHKGFSEWSVGSGEKAK